MTFSDYAYVRPDYPAVKEQMTQLTEDLKKATSLDEAKTAIKAIMTLQKAVDTQANLWSIRHSIDMNDAFYNEETNFWNEHSPLFAELATNFYKVVVASPFRPELGELLPETFFMQADNQLKTFSSEAIPLFQKENELTDAYSNLIASARIDFEGDTYNLAQMLPFTQSTDRATRKAASDALWDFFAQNESEFDRIYDELVKVRHEIATTLGFDNYVSYGYHKMNRFDYNADMVAVYRKEILKHVVPVVQELRNRQAKRIQVPDLKHYDLGLSFLDGNAKPEGSPETIVKAAQDMYHELSPETGAFFDFMLEHDLLDLLAKPGKDSGGYCTYIPDYASPFIFANFNGTSGDVDVLTHEAGHAFQVFRSRWIEALEVIWPTYESCEIHSMSMEFLTWPFMERFFGKQTAKYKFDHLSSALLFLPYGVLVDHFQHEVYSKPELTPAERKAVWKELSSLYLPDRDVSDSEALSRGIFWFRQGHIFASPFYYIDYTLAQVCALQFWKRTQIDKDSTAWADYLRICDLGGTKSFLQIVEAANLQSPFEKGALEATVAAAKAYLDGVNDLAL